MRIQVEMVWTCVDSSLTHACYHVIIPLLIHHISVPAKKNHCKFQLPRQRVYEKTRYFVQPTNYCNF